MIKNKKVFRVFYICNKCKHEWSSRAKKSTKESMRDIPRMCPKCKTVKWNDKIKK